MDKRVEELVANLDRDALAALIVALAHRHPEVVPTLASVSAAAHGLGASSPSLPPIELTRVRATLRESLRVGQSRGFYGGISGATMSAVTTPLLANAAEYLAAGRGPDVLELLAVLADELVEVSEAVYEEEGELYEFVEELGRLLAEALLLSPLVDTERRAWQERVAEWSDAWRGCLEAELFRPALLAARHGWTYPPLAAILRGDVEEPSSYAERKGGVVPALGPVCLGVLERQERWDEFMRLAMALGAAEQIVRALLRRGLREEAVSWVRNHPQSTSVTHQLLRLLEAAGAVEEALDLAERHLARGEEKKSNKAPDHGTLDLARWVRDTSASRGERERAFRAARHALHHTLSLSDYRVLRELAAEAWPALRPEVLALARTGRYSHSGEAPEIFLEEGLVEEAIVAVERRPDSGSLARVVEAAIPDHPDWVFRTCRREFERLVDGTRSGSYPQAVEWLANARRSLRAAGREAEWQRYLEELLRQHHRKRSLRPLLEQLR